MLKHWVIIVKPVFSHFHMEKWHITIATRIPQVSGLSCGCCPCPRPDSPPANTTFLPCLSGTMLRAPLVPASPSFSPSQRPVQPPPAACRKAQLQPPSFTFYVVHRLAEWQTILGQWPGKTAAAALVPTGHTKLYSSQLVSLSLWLNAWCSLMCDRCQVTGDRPTYLVFS